MNTRAYILYITLLAILSACSSETTLKEVGDITGSTDPMRFTVARESDTQPSETRASRPLTTGFMVSCYKNFATSNQQTVMPQYEVQHFTSGTAWDGTVRSYWKYDLVEGQYLRYWDFSAFPYRFNAIAPYPTNPSGFVLTDQSLKIPESYQAQTCINGAVSPANDVAEPYMLSQVQRNTDGKDQDLLSSTSEINNASTSKNRDVWMPFHHLNSKIRFGVYHTTQWMTANKTYIENLSIKVTSPNFVTKAQGYQATGNNSWRITTGNAGFYGLTQDATSGTAPDYHKILQFNGGDGLYDNDLTLCQTRETAFFLRCSDGIMQIPQEGVKMTVSFDLRNGDGSLNQSFTNVPIRLEYSISPGVYQDTFNWQAGILYTYYLVLGQIDHKLEITFTATLTPWEDVTGSLTTDLEQ